MHCLFAVVALFLVLQVADAFRRTTPLVSVSAKTQTRSVTTQLNAYEVFQAVEPGVTAYINNFVPIFKGR